MNSNDIAHVISRDLKLRDIEVLQFGEIIYPSQKAQAKTSQFIAQCIDTQEFDDKEEAIADSPNPNLAREVYKAKGPAYIYVLFSGIPTIDSLKAVEVIQDPVSFQKDLKAAGAKIKTMI